MSIATKAAYSNEVDSSSACELPEGWATEKLQQMGFWRSGGTPSRTKSEYFGSGIPWVKSGDLPDGPILETEEQITQSGLENSAAKLMPIGTVCMALYGATIGKLGIMTFEAATNQASANLIPDERLVSGRYVFYYLLSERQKFIDMGQGGAQPNISQEIVRAHPIRLAPLPEQHRIVAKLDALLAKVRTCQDRLAHIPTLLKRFRQSVLAAACSGKLTADWREENEVAETAAEFVLRVQEERREFFRLQTESAKKLGQRKPKRRINESAAQIEASSNGSPDTWCTTRIGDVCECLDYMRVPINKTERQGRHGEIPYYGANGQVGWIDTHLFDEELVLVVEDESFIGREKPFSYVVRGKSWVNNHAHVLRPLGGMPADFLNACLAFYNFVPLTSGTTGRRKLNQEALVDAPLKVGPVAEQKEIVRRVNQLFQFADQIEYRFQKARVQVERLTQAILAKAFRGELVETEATRARREGRDYETAEQLLARIKAEKTEEPEKRPRGPKRANSSKNSGARRKKAAN